MGKKENIKRAKRLREAKRQKEREILSERGLGPAGIALKEKMESEGNITQINQGKVKYSELLRLFVHPTVSHTDDISIIKTKYFFGSFAWNTAIIKEKSHEEYIVAKNTALSALRNIPEAEQLFDEMVKRKEDDFAAYKNIIVNLEIKRIHQHDYELSVVTSPLK